MVKETLHLRPIMHQVIQTLKTERKFPAVHTYTSTLNSFSEFLQDAESLVERIFTPGKLKEYQEWLLCRGKSWNTVSTYLRTLRAVHNRLVDIELSPPAPKLFDHVYTKVESRTKRSLSKEQTNKLLTADPETIPQTTQSALAYFKLLFLFHGMPFIDLAHLRKQDISGNNIIYCRHKTGKQISVHIPSEALALITQWSNKDPKSTYLFPILNDSCNKKGRQYNEYLRALQLFNRKLARIATYLLPNTRLSSYTPRHTWATLAFHQGIPIGIISKALGHSSIKVTETYLKPFENEKIDLANEELINSVIKFGEEKSVA